MAIQNLLCVKATFEKKVFFQRQTLMSLALTRKFLEAWVFCQRARQLDSRKEVERMQDSVLVSKQTFEAMVKHLKEYIHAVDEKIQAMTAEKRGEIPIKRMAERKRHAETLLQHAMDEAMLVSSQKVNV
jgi:hypothetical protein